MAFLFGVICGALGATLLLCVIALVVMSKVDLFNP